MRYLRPPFQDRKLFNLIRYGNTQSKHGLLAMVTKRDAVVITRLINASASVPIGFRSAPAIIRPNQTLKCGNVTRATATNFMGRTHGMSGHRVHRIWRDILQRCNNPKRPAYPYYGGRGITVCARWLKFENFLEDMGTGEPQSEIEREDNDGNYEPGNCRWATHREQCQNRSNTIKVKIGDEVMCLKSWAARFGIKYLTVYMRVRRGWSAERALAEPLPKTGRWAR